VYLFAAIEKLFTSKLVFYMYLAICFITYTGLAVSGLVQVYQTLEEFQEAAAHQLLENSHCQGSLPVSISHL
jgi:hypothetical protein